MQGSSKVRALPILIVLALFTSLILIPVFYVSKAQTKGGGKGLVERTESHADRIPNYDIRTDKAAFGKLAEIRGRSGRTASSVADRKDEMVKAEAQLKSAAADVKVTYSPQSRMPEVISPSETLGKQALFRSQGGLRSETLRAFVGKNRQLFGLGLNEVDSLKVAADYQNPEGAMSFVSLEQKVNGLPVFAGEVRAGFSKNGDLIRVINDLASGADDGVSIDFGDPATALMIAGQAIGSDEFNTRKEQTISADQSKVVFGTEESAPSAEKMYFPTEPGVLVPAWRVLLWQPVNAYYVIVDAGSQTVLWRKNITEDQTQSVTYSVYPNTASMINIADSPAPLSPGPISPSLGTQGLITPRTTLSFIGNEGVYSFNNLGWLTDGVNVLDGNAVQVGPDRDCIVTSPGVCQTTAGIAIPKNGIDANISGSSFRNFTFAYNPGPGNPAPGDAPLPAGPAADVCSATPPATSDYQKGVATQLFYIVNRYHDEMYRLGFTEQARNFQSDNFGRGGVGNDRISAQAQDCSGTNNANFATPADGDRGQMQMYIFPNMSPDRDGGLDADIVIHELTHGLSNRLHGNSFGLTTAMAGGMGEGWSDFYAHAMLSEPTDPLDGVYPAGGYSTYQLLGPGFTSNYYYGIRRFPKAILTSTGGPNNRPHNPLTFADVDASTANLSNGAFAPAPTGSSNDAVHAAGEVWSSMLWEVRAKYIARLGWSVGNRRILQHVTDGMKLSPINPTFVDARDAIVAAAMAGGDPADVKDVWEGFASRGLGVAAQVSVVGNGGGETRVSESYELPNLTQPGITVTDTMGNNNGYPEPGEPIRVAVPVQNLTGTSATGVTVQFNGGQTLAYGTIAHNGTASNEFDYTIPSNAGCGSVVSVSIRIESSLGLKIYARDIVVGVPNAPVIENFDGVTAPAIPNGWTVAIEGSGSPFVTSTIGPNSAPNAVFTPNIGSPGGAILTSPPYAIQAQGATFSFRHSYRTEMGWDGGILEYSINGGSWQEYTSATLGSYLEGGYNSYLGDSTGNPIENKKAWSGESNGYITTKGFFPVGSVGQNVRLRWRFGSDNNTTGIGSNPGWSIDNVNVINSYGCSFTPPSSGNKRSDFDGDGISDMAVFRPVDGLWYTLPSASAGSTVFQWGTSGDSIVPADYDNDGKTDTAIYRPGQGGADNTFWVFRSSDSTATVAYWGIVGDIPVVRDYDGDELPDYAVYRPSDQVWYVREADGGFQGFNFGASGDIPIAGDFDGDKKGDLTLYRNGDWITRRSSDGNVVGLNWGLGTDIPVPADYDNDGKDDYAVFRPNGGTWWTHRSSDSQNTAVQWGTLGDVPVPGDYDGDGKYDPAVYRNGDWWVTFSQNGGVDFVNWGLQTDVPIPKGYIP